MATNPMQRKARQSFLLGVIITLLLASIVIFFLYNQIQNLNEKIKKEVSEKVQVYILTQDVKSGQTITSDMFTMKAVSRSTVPADATSDISSMLSAYSLCDKQGNLIKTATDDKGNLTMYMEIDGNKTTVYQDEETGGYYRTSSTGGKIAIETTEKPLVAKIAMKANTVITGTMISVSDEIQTDDYREQTYNMISLPIDLVTGDYVDVRLMLPNGQDYIVLSKKQVTIPDVNGEYLADTIKLSIPEGDLLTLSSAIVEAYQIEGSKLYAIKYTEAGNQKPATETYMPTNDVIQQIQRNPNIVSEAMKEIKERWTSSAQYFREEDINKADRNPDNVKSEIQESTQATQEAREEYLSTIFAE